MCSCKKVNEGCLVPSLFAFQLKELVIDKNDKVQLHECLVIGYQQEFHQYNLGMVVSGF